MTGGGLSIRVTGRFAGPRGPPGRQPVRGSAGRPVSTTVSGLHREGRTGPGSPRGTPGGAATNRSRIAGGSSPWVFPGNSGAAVGPKGLLARAEQRRKLAGQVLLPRGRDPPRHFAPTWRHRPGSVRAGWPTAWRTILSEGRVECLDLGGESLEIGVDFGVAGIRGRFLLGSGYQQRRCTWGTTAWAAGPA
ncbi:MAG: hypothetical protein Ct9H300mP1_33400 [Planctomycetaceae bacterium]|nr:MAG: hypothetical protein Ct9H300mP1_33400 [Planctomycetaceae bacterium]